MTDAGVTRNSDLRKNPLGPTLKEIMRTWTKRFALQLIKDNGHLESFLVDLQDFAEAHSVAMVLRAQGWTVVINKVKSRLDVKCGLPASV